MVTLDPVYTEELVSAVQTIIDSSENRKVQAWDEIKVKLVGAGLAAVQQVQPQFAGVHPCNRSTLGVDPVRVHEHGHDVVRSGFSWSKASDAVALEVPPAPHNAEILRTNKELVHLSDGLVPEFGHLKLAAVGGSHTNSFLRALAAGTRTTVKEFGTTLDKGFSRAMLDCTAP